MILWWIDLLSPTGALAKMSMVIRNFEDSASKKQRRWKEGRWKYVINIDLGDLYSSRFLLEVGGSLLTHNCCAFQN